MACFYRNQKVTLTRRHGDNTVTSIYDNASTVTIEDYRGVSFLLIQYMDKNKLCNVRYNCNDILAFVLTAATPKKPVEKTEPVEAEDESGDVVADEDNDG